MGSRYETANGMVCDGCHSVPLVVVFYIWLEMLVFLLI